MESVATAQSRNAEARRALEDLYRREREPMIRLAYNMVGSQPEAEELVQESFVDVYRHLDHIDQPGAYLRTAVVNRCRSLLRRREAAPERDRVRTPVKNHGVELLDVLERLTADQRTIIVLRYYGQYRSAEIADVLGMPAATVRSHLRRGLRSLKKELA